MQPFNLWKWVILRKNLLIWMVIILLMLIAYLIIWKLFVV